MVPLKLASKGRHSIDVSDTASQSGDRGQIIFGVTCSRRVADAGSTFPLFITQLIIWASSLVVSVATSSTCATLSVAFLVFYNYLLL